MTKHLSAIQHSSHLKPVAALLDIMDGRYEWRQYLIRASKSNLHYKETIIDIDQLLLIVYILHSVLLRFDHCGSAAAICTRDKTLSTNHRDTPILVFFFKSQTKKS